MTVSINSPVQSSYIFIVIFFIASLISMRKKREKELFSSALSQELKGLAILSVIFAHISFLLVNDQRFLYPLSIISGVGVNMFLFLSGYGLMMSNLKKGFNIIRFYKRRLLKLFIPFWITLIVFFLADFFILKIDYPWSYIISAFAGWFPTADAFRDINSPLWYFTMILFYYLVFPLVFSKKFPWLSALIMYAIGYVIIQDDPVLIKGAIGFYKLHIIAFPLGMFFGWLFYRPFIFPALWLNMIRSKVNKIRQSGTFVKISSISKGPYMSDRLKMIFRKLSNCFLIALLIYAVCYLALNSGVGQDPDTEQLISIITMLAILFLFLCKNIEIRLFYLFGLYSYEIYLLHWPIMYRYDIIYKSLPAWLATIFYLLLFLGLGLGLQSISKKIIKK